MKCELCKGAVDGQPFTLSDLTDAGCLLAVCRTCAGSRYIIVEIGGRKIEINRDDYIEADREQLEAAISKAARELAEYGWTCESLKLKADQKNTSWKRPNKSAT